MYRFVNIPSSIMRDKIDTSHVDVDVDVDVDEIHNGTPT
jgi:hypothetical protein